MVMNWLEFNFVTHPNLFVHFACWSDKANSKKICHGFWLIWHVVVWVKVEKVILVEVVKAISWFWVLSKLQVVPCLLNIYFLFKNSITQNLK